MIDMIAVAQSDLAVDTPPTLTLIDLVDVVLGKVTTRCGDLSAAPMTLLALISARPRATVRCRIVPFPAEAILY